MLRLWNFYRDEYIKQESQLCSICNNLAIGDFYDRDWQQIRLCGDCYDVLAKRSAANIVPNKRRFMIKDWFYRK